MIAQLATLALGAHFQVHFRIVMLQLDICSRKFPEVDSLQLLAIIVDVDCSFLNNAAARTAYDLVVAHDGRLHHH